MNDSPFVWYQTVEHSNGEATVYSFPAVVTARSWRPAPVYDENGKLVRDPDGNVVYNEPVEVVSLTVFVRGGFEYHDDVWPYADRHGQIAGSTSYRLADAKAPEINLREDEEKRLADQARAQGQLASAPTQAPDTQARRITPA